MPRLDAIPARRQRRLEHVEHLLRRAHALRAGVVVRAEQPEREVRLGSEHECDQGGREPRGWERPSDHTPVLAEFKKV